MPYKIEFLTGNFLDLGMKSVTVGKIGVHCLIEIMQ